LKLWLEKNGIQCGIYYPSPIHLQPIYRQMYGYKEGDFPISERHAKRALSLPIFPDLKVIVQLFEGKPHYTIRNEFLK
jgi:dTDP-4-amino-4,6-dideoxygalactose transaminase